MDLLIDLIDFMVMRASKTGFDSQEQLQKYINCCTRILKMHPSAAAALAPKPEPKSEPAPTLADDPATIDWGVV